MNPLEHLSDCHQRNLSEEILVLIKELNQLRAEFQALQQEVVALKSIRISSNPVIPNNV